MRFLYVHCAMCISSTDAINVTIMLQEHNNANVFAQTVWINGRTAIVWMWMNEKRSSLYMHTISDNLWKFQKSILTRTLTILYSNSPFPPPEENDLKRLKENSLEMCNKKCIPFHHASVRIDWNIHRRSIAANLWIYLFTLFTWSRKTNFVRKKKERKFCDY